MSERPMNPRRTVDLIGVPLDLGGARRGTDSGPSALRIAGLVERVQELGYEVHDTGDVDVASRERSEVGPASARYLECIARSCEELREEVARSLAAGHLPLALGGDHSLALGTLAGLRAADAHGAHDSDRHRLEAIGPFELGVAQEARRPEPEPLTGLHPQLGRDGRIVVGPSPRRPVLAEHGRHP